MDTLKEKYAKTMSLFQVATESYKQASFALKVATAASETAAAEFIKTVHAYEDEENHCKHITATSDEASIDRAHQQLYAAREQKKAARANLSAANKTLAVAEDFMNTAKLEYEDAKAEFVVTQRDYTRVKEEFAQTESAFTHFRNGTCEQ